MPQSAKFNYLSRNYSQIREELIQFLQKNYPEIKDYNDSSVGMALLELNAAVGDILSFHTDRVFNETQLDYVQERKNILALARTYGLKIPSKRPSITVLSLSVDVPPGSPSTTSNCQQIGTNYFNCNYTPVIKAGSKFVGGGQVFEVLEDIDFKSKYNSNGVADRTETALGLPAGSLTNYRLTKNVIAVNGETKVLSRYITNLDVRPFFEIVLPETNVLSIEQVILINGNIKNTPEINQFFDKELLWYEVDHLAQDKVFIDGPPSLLPTLDTLNPTGTTSGVSLSYSSVKTGQWKSVTKKFMVDRTDKGYTKLIFGAGVTDKTLDQTTAFPGVLDIYNKMINNDALGETLKANATLFIRYRVGGGSQTNLGVNVIQTPESIDWQFIGSDSTIKQSVTSSLTVNNPNYPAQGGRDDLTIEEIRNLLRYNFGTQNRAVQIRDYLALLDKMPTRYGAPYRLNVIEDRNSITVFILTLNEENKLDFNGINPVILNNVAEYLSEYRMINDYVKIKWGRVVNLSVTIDILVQKNVKKSDVANKIGKIIRDYFDISNRQMGENIFIGKIYQKITEQMGDEILNITDIKFYNPIFGIDGPQYSSQGYPSTYVSSPTTSVANGGRLIDTSSTLSGSNGILLASADSMFEIRFDEDIKINVNTLSFSF